ncbi:MAG: RNA polymerase sigma factor [Planctomycetota bacterium]
MRRERFEQLVHRHHAAAYRAAHRVLRRDADAQDVCQQVFVDLWRRGRDVPDEQAEAHVRWLAVRHAYNALRARGRRVRHEQQVIPMDQSSHDPVDAAVQSERRAEVLEALLDLDDSLRTPILLRYQEGLTLAAIGRVVAVGESTVHERIERGLARLRAKLSGSLGAGVTLERVIESGFEPAVPTSTLEKLLGIPATFTPIAIGKLALAAGAVILLGAAAIVFSSADRGIESAATPVGIGGAERGTAEARERIPADSPRRALVGAVDGVASPGLRDGGSREESASAPATSDGKAMLGGLAVDPTDGRGIAGVDMVAHCPELDRKATPFEIVVQTDSLGRFTIEVPIRHVDGVRWELGARHGTTLLSTPLALELRPGDRRLDLRVEVAAPDEDRKGDWSRLVRVLDRAQRPVAGVTIAVARRIGSASFTRLVAEVDVRTDAAGLAQLTGDRLGDKRMRIIPFGLPFRAATMDLAIDETRVGEMTVELVDDLPRALLLLDARSDAPLPGISVWAERDGASLAVGRSNDDGRLVLRGLDEQPCDLIGGGGARSMFRLRTVPAPDRPDEPRVVRLKRLDDPSPIGSFTPEVHGHVIDAASGKPVEVASGDVFLRGLPAVGGPNEMEELRRSLLTPTPWQTGMFGEPPPPSAEFHLAAWSTGRFAVVLFGSGFAPAVAGPFELGDDNLIADVQLRAEQAHELAVRVLDARGEPLSMAEVWIASDSSADDQARVARAAELRRAAESGRRAHAGRGQRTDAAGFARLPRIPAGFVFTVHAAHANGEHARVGSIQLRPGAVGEVLEIRMPLARMIR